MSLNFTEKTLLTIEEFLKKRGRKKFTLESFEQFLFKKNKKAPPLISEGDFRREFHYLLEVGYLKKGEDNKYSFTIKGLAKTIKTRLKLNKKTQKPLNKKWQMVIFDIPESKRKSRDAFRNALKILGFKQYQKSIWVGNYNFLKELKILIEALDIKPYIKVFFVKEIYKPV